MADFISVQALKEQLNFTDDQGEYDDALLGRKLKAAQNYIESLLGFELSEAYGSETQSVVPAAIIEAIYQTAAHWYENREAVLVGVSAQELPFGVWPIINEFRKWSF